ncbi:MAG TPA: fibronectin type III domain-containing protein, partial [Bryobacteraceae bacterium]|nr:fibronectin type III domain-containing protein [Bryobacteraceae bacterium]
KPGLVVTGTPFGATVKLPHGNDWVFRNPEGIAFQQDGIEFEGTAGLVRHGEDRAWSLALFHGKRVAAGGLSLASGDAGLGVSAQFTSPEEVSGVYFTREARALSIGCAACDSSVSFYADGIRLPFAKGAAGLWQVKLPAGRHEWQFCKGLPRPARPAIIRTENGPGAVNVVWRPAANAERYRIELSEDGARTWRQGGETAEASCQLTGLKEGGKVHVRVIARNARYESEPGYEYPVYPTSKAPAHPDGLKLRIADGRVEAAWGEVLGVREYRLYRRQKGTVEFRGVYSGPAMTFSDAVPGVRKAFEQPGILANALRDKAGYTIYEYAVSAVSLNGESAKSPVADTDPARWTNWDPKPGERFRRRYTYNTLDYSLLGTEENHERYYPR